MCYSVVNFERYLTDICKSCYFSIGNICRIKKHLSTEHTKISVNAFIKLQNCEARLIVGGRKDDHITPLLRELH